MNTDVLDLENIYDLFAIANKAFKAYYDIIKTAVYSPIDDANEANILVLEETFLTW
jgi:hypothetical protein